MLYNKSMWQDKEYEFRFKDTKTYEGHTNITQSYGICFTQEGKVVIGKMPGNTWCLPGGSIEKGETPENTLIREVDEELSLTLKKFELIGVQEVHNCTDNKFDCSQLRFVCLIKEIKELTEDPDVNLMWERIIIKPEEVFTKYINWPIVGPHLMKRALKIFNSWKK